MVFGLKEEAGEDVREKVSELLSDVEEKPHVSDCVRVGKEDSKKPVKVTLRSPEAVSQILAKSSKLSKIDGRRSVYLKPDRSQEEREFYANLTREMKQKMTDNPEKYFFIRNRKICCTERRTFDEKDIDRTV